MPLLRFILYPLVPLYAALINVRNWLFDNGIFKARKVNAKVISVGNITVGGSGKTPMVIYLTNLLKNERRNVGVLSRGYGRKSSGYLLVADSKNLLTTVDQCGDEIYHTATECKVPAAVCENRVNGAKRLIEDTGINTIVLDDAYQHRWIYRDVNLLICEQKFLNKPDFLNQNLLPTGFMRENFKSIERADAIILNRKFSEKEAVPNWLAKYSGNKKIFNTYYYALGFVDIKRNIEHKIEEFEGQKSLVVSGIANPYSFINALKQTKVDTHNQMIFSDHKNYTLKEIQKIRKEFYTTNSHSVITTQKDAVKLYKFSKELDDIDIFYLKIQLAMDEAKDFQAFIIEKIS
jgi:tetraacyldisaccharide 4'-kinase